MNKTWQYIMDSMRQISGVDFKRCGRSVRFAAVIETVLEKVGLRLGFEEQIIVK